MFRKWKLKREINACKARIVELERRRSRSQAALVEAILTHTTPEDADVEYFNKFTQEINDERCRMQEKQAELDALN